MGFTGQVETSQTAWVKTNSMAFLPQVPQPLTPLPPLQLTCHGYPPNELGSQTHTVGPQKYLRWDLSLIIQGPHSDFHSET